MAKKKGLSGKDYLIKDRVREIANKKGMLYKETVKKLNKCAMPGLGVISRAGKSVLKNKSKKTMQLGNAYANTPRKEGISLGRIATGVGLGGAAAGLYTLAN